MKIKEQYQKLSKKYKLPVFDDLNNNFEIITIDQDEFLMREIRRKIAEKIELYLKIIEPILQPEPIMIDMHECKVLNEEEKKKIYDIYKKLMYFSKLSIEISVDENDKKTSEFINEVWEDWKNIKKYFLELVIKLKKSWLKETDINEKLGYMG